MPSTDQRLRLRIVGIFALAIGTIYGVAGMVAREAFALSVFMRAFAVGFACLLIVHIAWSRSRGLMKRQPIVAGGLNGLIVGLLAVVAPIAAGIDPFDSSRWHRWLVLLIGFALIGAVASGVLQQKVRRVSRGA